MEISVEISSIKFTHFINNQDYTISLTRVMEGEIKRDKIRNSYKGYQRWNAEARIKLDFNMSLSVSSF